MELQLLVEFNLADPSSGCQKLTQLCNQHGAANSSAAGDKCSCVCTDGWTGPGCTIPPPSSAASSGAAAAGVIVPLSLLGVAGAMGLFIWRRKNPYKPYASLLPKALQPASVARASAPIYSSSAAAPSESGSLLSK
jgi:hypothetical protein